MIKISLIFSAMMPPALRASALTVFAALALPALAPADLVTDANTTLMQAIREFNTGATPASRDFAILQTAVFDSVNGIDTRYQFYRVAPAAAAGSSQQAAAAAAAHSVLTALYPSKAASFDATFSAQLSALPSGPSRDNGVSWGNMVASNILNWRASDHSGDFVNYVSGSQAGDWRPTAPGFGPPDNPQWPTVTPWTLTGGAQFRPTTGPPALASQAYTAYYTEAFELGAATGSNRTVEQTDTALFWSYNSGSQTAVGHWNSVAHAVVAGKGNSMVDNARVFAALNTALADAAIVAGDAAYSYEFWRPITAIREAATDGNINTAPLVNWDPLVTTLGSPEHVSANAAYAGAASTVLNYLLGTETGFSLKSDRVPTVTNFYSNFDLAAGDAALAGIYGGIQFRNSVVDGLDAGKLLGNQTAYQFFQPALIPEPSATGFLLLAAIVTCGRRRRD